jgi:hypothetical protein
MATSSFFNNVVIDTEDKFKSLVVALEKSERSQPDYNGKSAAKVTDADDAWIQKTFGKPADKH